MSERRSFSAHIERARGGGAYVTVPFDVERAYGRKRVPVRATIDGVAYRGTLVRMGGERHVLGVLKSIRDEIGKQPGDVVEIVVEQDAEPRVVDVPPDLAEALRQAPQARSTFESLSYSHQREYVTWIAEAKRAETRARRIAQTIEMLARGEKHR